MQHSLRAATTQTRKFPPITSRLHQSYLTLLLTWWYSSQLFSCKKYNTGSHTTTQAAAFTQTGQLPYSLDSEIAPPGQGRVQYGVRGLDHEHPLLLQLPPMLEAQAYFLQLHEQQFYKKTLFTSQITVQTHKTLFAMISMLASLRMFDRVTEVIHQATHGIMVCADASSPPCPSVRLYNHVQVDIQQKNNKGTAVEGEKVNA